MENLKEQLVELLSKPQVAGFATLASEGKPWVRNVVICGDDTLTLGMATNKSSRKVAHVQHNAAVHLSCGENSLTEMGHYMQIEGVAEVDERQETKTAFWNPGLTAYFSGPTDPEYVVVKVKATRIELNRPEAMGQPLIWERGEAS